jgi:predicted nuclease of predicted toxin-antitoxin system
MKVLLDACVWGGVRRDLEAAGHDVVWAGDWEEDPGDDEILERANREGRVLVTLDKDFGEIAVVRRVPHGGIVRLVNWPARDQARACLLVLDRHGEELQKGSFVVAEPGRLRMRSPEWTEVG